MQGTNDREAPRRMGGAAYPDARSRLRRAIEVRAWRLVFKVASRLGLRVGRSRDYHLVQRNFHSPVPDPAEIPAYAWSRRSALRGVAFDTAAQIRFAETELAPYMAEFDAPAEKPTERGVFYRENGYYQGIETEVLYALVRHLRPQRVHELGSGFSSLVIAEACAANRRDGADVEVRIDDPHPASFLEERDQTIAVEAVRAQDVPLSTFEALAANDILFVDTTHVSKVASDVNFIVLEVLPRLAPGVVVHFHDVFLPWEYPRWWIEERGRYWNEQYLVQGFLTLNRSWEVLFACHAVWREHRDRLERLVAPGAPGEPTAFWIRNR